MSLPRSVSLPVLILLATMWATVLVMFGLWLMIDGPHLVWVRIRSLAGVAAVGVGLFVFMWGVADRVFPAVGRRLTTWWVEMATFLGATVSGVLAAVLFITRGA